jgi:PIN domain nuclease of toxin-antitoxin system
MRDKGNDLLLSAASAWEIAIKSSLGKLPLPEPPEVFIPRHMVINQVRPLPISVEHALAVASLPPHHRDPFDRLLVAQAKTENIPLLSADAILKPYSIQVLW